MLVSKQSEENVMWKTQIEWDEGKEGYFFWDEVEAYQIGFWPTREAAEEQFEKYSRWVDSDEYPYGNWTEYEG